MITLVKKDKEIDITLTLSTPVGTKPKITIEATGDLLHHVVEGIFDIVDKLARMETIGHQSKEWKGK